jgi:hypothetical protein
MRQSVADLLWAITSPSLITDPWVEQPAEFTASDVDADHLDAYLDQHPTHRVGHYFERLLDYWLREIRGVEVEATGLQIREGKRTVGELDFLYRCDGVLTHCEASVKFFLHFPQRGSSHFPGPNASDNFEKKISRLFEHQLALSASHVPEVGRREAFVRGIRFFHPDHPRPSELPNRMAPTGQTGSWLFAAELDRFRSRSSVRCTVVEKPHWLAPQVNPRLQDIGTFCDDLNDHFGHGRGHPVMASIRDLSGNEVDRMFVVPDHWPAPAASPAN